MGRVFYMRNVREHEVESYEALGWIESGRKLYALDEVSVCMSWDHEGDPVEPEPPCYHIELPKPTTRDVVRWNFAPWDLICVIGLALAGLALGAFELLSRNNMIRWLFMGACALGAVSSCIDHDALCVILNTFGVYLWSLDPVRP